MNFNPLEFLKSLPATVTTFLRGIVESFRVKNEKVFTVIISVIVGLVTLIFQLLYGSLSETIVLTEQVSGILLQVGIWLSVLGFLLNVDVPELPVEDTESTTEIND